MKHHVFYRSDFKDTADGNGTSFFDDLLNRLDLPHTVTELEVAIDSWTVLEDKAQSDKQS